MNTLLLVLSLAGALQTADSSEAALAPLGFLLGEWEAVGTGNPADGTGGFTFAAGVQDHVIVRTNHAEYPANGGRPASRHDDLMVIYVEGSTAKAEYFDSEGHIIRYVVQPGAAGEVVFVSEGSASAPRYRLSYTLAPDGRLNGRFDIAPPGRPDAFAPFLSWAARKIK